MSSRFRSQTEYAPTVQRQDTLSSNKGNNYNGLIIPIKYDYNHELKEKY